MMKIYFRLMLVVALMACANVLSAKKVAKIAFTTNQQDLGEVVETGGDVTVEFEFVNSGKAPLLIGEVTASCGCTTPTWPKEAILKGKTGKISLKFNPKGHLGAFTANITVKSNAETPEVYLVIKATVVDPPEKIYTSHLGKLLWKLNSNYLNIGQITSKETRVMDVPVYNPTKDNVKVGFTRVPSNMKAEIEPTTLAPGEKGLAKFTYDASQKKDFDYVSDRIYVTYDDVYDQNIAINVGAIIGEDFSKYTADDFAKAPKIEFQTVNFKFDTLTAGQEISHEFIFKNIGQSDLYIRKAQASCGCTATVPPVDKIQAGETNKIKMTFNSTGKSGQQYKTITVISNDPKNTRVVLVFEGFVKSTSPQKGH